MKTLKLLCAAAAAVTMTFTAEAAKTAKAVVADSGATLKFVYDETNYGTKGTDWFSVAEAEAQDPGSTPPWWNLRNAVTKVLFDGSFAGYQPGHCAWFLSFAKLATVEGLENLDVSEAESLAYMFSQCESLTSLDLSGFNTAKVTSMSGMFYGCKNLKTILVSDAFTTAAVTASGLMFSNCTALKGGNGTAFDSSKVDKTYARIDGKDGQPGYFTRAPTAKAVVEEGGKTLRFVYDGKDYGTKGTHWFSVAEAEAIDPDDEDVPWYICSETVTKVVFDPSFAAYRPKQCGFWFFSFSSLATVENLAYLDTSDATNFAYMFDGCSSLTTLDVTGFDTANVTDMYSMFYGCSTLTTLDVSGFDTSKVTYMTFMFYGCSSLTTLDVSGFDTANVTDMYGMFCGCSSLTTLDVSGFDTAKVTDMSCMFEECSSLTVLDVSGFDTTNVTGMHGMFSDCESLMSLDLTGFDTANVTDMCWMFGGCSSLMTLDVTGFDTANVTDMDYMFKNCSSLTVLDVSGFDTAKVTNMYSMFYGCSSLEAICASDRFVTDQVSYSSSMFQSCSKLVGGAGTAYDSTKTDKTYARIDGKNGQLGYFTEGHKEIKEIATGAYASLDLAKDLDIKIPEDVDYAKGDKVTVKVEGLAKGLKLAQDKTSKAWTLSGVPTEEIDFARNPMYARVTVTYKDKTKGDKGKVESLQPIVLSIAAPAPTVLTAGVLGQEYGPFDVTALWSAVGTSKEWSFKGWPAGLKYKDGKLSGKPTKAGVYPITATWKHKINGKSVSETFSAVLTVWGSEGEKGFRHTSQQYGAAVNETIADAKSVSGLPTGLKFKDGKVTGTPTKPGVFAVTVTKTDSTKETFLWKVTPGVNDGILDGIGWEAEDSAVTVMQGAIRDWPVTIPAGAKVTASGLPAGLKLAQDKTTKKWTISGTPTKQGNFVVTLKTVRNGVTVTERISIVVEPNEWTGDWHLVQTYGDTDASRLAEVKVSANGTVKLVLTEGVAGKVKKTTVTVKHLDADGTRATVTLPKDKKDPLSKDRTCILGFKAQFLNIDNVTQGCLAEVDESWVNYDVSTVVVEERIGGVPYSYGYVTATFKSGKFTLAGKLWDGTAVKGTCYPLGYSNFFSPVLVTDQQKNSITITLGGVDVVNRAFVRENGTMILGLDVMTASFAAEELKSKKFNQLCGSTRLFISGHDDEGAAVTQLVDIPEKSRAASVSAQGLAKFKVSDEDGWEWVCELLPVRNGDALRFRGIATGTKRGEDVRIAPVWDVQ